MKKKMFRIAAIMWIGIITGLSGCGQNEVNSEEAEVTEMQAEDKVEEKMKNQEEDQTENIQIKEIKVTSESLKEDGYWSSTINAPKANPAGDNSSPQLAFDAVEGASCYAIYMIDTSAGNWLHWKAEGVLMNTLAEGQVLDNSQYIGPYPPSGVHTYEVWVYALKEAPDKYPGNFDSSNLSLDDMEATLDKVGGINGNILGKGCVSGIVEKGLEK